MIARRGAADPSVKWADFRLTYSLWRLKLAMKAYDPDQPRAPGGTEEGGQWIAVDEPLDLIRLAAGIDKADKGLTVQNYVAKYCKGGIYEVLPGQFLHLEVGKVMDRADSGESAARRCIKLLSRGEYRK